MNKASLYSDKKGALSPLFIAIRKLTSFCELSIRAFFYFGCVFKVFIEQIFLGLKKC